MFGSRRPRNSHPDGTTVVTTTHTTKTMTPHYPSRSSGLMNRLRPRKNHTHAHHHTTGAAPATTSRPAKTSPFSRRSHRPVATTTTAAPRRKTSMGDKMSGAMLKLKGSLSGRPGVKAAGTRRMHGTDGRGAQRYY